MALTPEEFAVVVSVRDAAVALDGKANDIRALMERVTERANPEDPLNQSITFAQLYSDYYQIFNSAIAGLGALSAPFLNPLPPPQPKP